jgi:MFS family permease
MRARLAAGTRDIFRSLSVRNFRLFFMGQLISQIGTWLTTLALTLLVLHLTNSGLAVGGLVACQFGPVLLLGAWGGLVADRSDKRRLLLITQTLEMAQSFALATLAFLHHPPLAAFYVVAVAGGFMLAFDNPARRSFVAEMVPEEHVQNAVMMNSALMTSSRVFGPALAGLLVVTVGFPWCFLVDGFSYLAVIWSLWVMRTEDLFQPVRTAKARGQVREGLRYIRSLPELWIPLAMMTLVGTLTFNFAVVLPLFVERTLHGSDGTYTLLYSFLSVGSVVGALSAARRRTIDLHHIVAAGFAFGVAMLAFAAAPGLPLAFPFALVVGAASISFLTATTAVVQMRADPAMRGRVLAIQAIVMIGSTPIGGPILGWVCDAYSARIGLVVGGVAALVAAGGGYLAGKRTRERVASRPAPGTATATAATTGAAATAGAAAAAAAAATTALGVGQEAAVGATGGAAIAAGQATAVDAA